MHELSYGSNTRKTRFKPVFIVPIIIPLATIHNPMMYVWTAMIAIGLILNYFNERQTETPKQIYPTYSLKRQDLLCMLRNAETAKRGK